MLIACAAIMQSFMLIITMPLGGITAGTQSILGYNYGACDEKRVMKAFRCIVLLCLVFCGIMFLLAQTVSGAFVKIFTKDPAYIDMAAYMIRTYSLGVLGLTIQYPFVDGMTGMGLVKWGLTFSMLRKGIFLVSVFVLPPIFGATAVMFSEPLSDVVSAVFSGCAAMFLLPKLVAKQCCK
ncbi:MAG: MATE family efflux transporter [Butyricicoccus sp.]